MDSHCFKLHRSHLISFNLSNVSEIFWFKSEGTVSKFRKRKIKFLCSAHLLHKTGAWNYEVSCRSRAATAKKYTKKRDAGAKFFFCQSKPIVFFCWSPSPLQKLPIVVIQKFCYHGNLTSLLLCLSRLAPSVTRVVICVSRAFCSTDQEKRETARSLENITAKRVFLTALWWIDFD